MKSLIFFTANYKEDEEIMIVDSSIKEAIIDMFEIVGTYGEKPSIVIDNIDDNSIESYDATEIKNVETILNHYAFGFDYNELGNKDKEILRNSYVNIIKIYPNLDWILGLLDKR